MKMLMLILAVDNLIFLNLPANLLQLELEEKRIFKIICNLLQ